jgi:transcriptional regulator with XRE-family HTH domain
MLSVRGVTSPTMSASPYGERLAKAMELARLTGPDARNKLAEAIGITKQAVGQVLTGSTRALSAETSARAARFLRVDHYWLATGEGEPKPKALSEDAMSFAARYDKLSQSEREKFSALLIVAREGVSDAEIERKMPITRRKETSK